MANRKHLKMLKRDIDAWDKWRRENPNIQPDFSGMLLGDHYLMMRNMKEANLTRTQLTMAMCFGCNLYRANLAGARLVCVDLQTATLRNANLTHTHLYGVNFSNADLEHADFTGAEIGYTSFAEVDLSNVIGLESTKHIHPSTIGIDTLHRSKGKIPEAFLRGCGVPEDFIKYAHSLVANPIEYYSSFISYSSRDKDFADRLHADLQANKIRCWYAPEDLKIGDKFRTRIEESIRIYDKVMIVLSENSILSAWVEEEVEAALERERQHPNSLVLFPIRLDSAVMETSQAWAANLRRTRHIGDFTHWKNHDSYQKAFDRLLRDLKSETNPTL